MLAVVTADTANGADRDAVLRPGARREGQPQHWSQNIRVTRFAPRDPSDFGVDISGHERTDGGMMTSQTQCEIILELLLGRKTGAQHVPPVGENSQKAVRRVAQFDQAASFDCGQPRFQEWGGAPDLRDQSLWGNPLGPCVAGSFDDAFGQITSM